MTFTLRSRCLFAVAIVVPALASADRLVLVRETRAPFSFDGVHHLLVEHGALVTFGDDVETRADRALRIDATTVTEAPALSRPDGIEEVICGDARWVLEETFDSNDPQRLPKFAIRIPGPADSPIVWRGGVPAFDLSIRCAAGHVIVGEILDGEVVTQVLSPAVEPERRVRVAPSGVLSEMTWAAATPDELYVAVQSQATGATELVSIANGAVTHRVPLTDSWSGPFVVDMAVTDRLVVVGMWTPGSPSAVQSFTRGDLAPGKCSALPGVQLDSLSPGPDGVVAVELLDGWIGDRAHPSHAGERHYAWILRLWNPTTGVVGPAEDFGENEGTFAWLGKSLVVLLPFKAGADHDEPTRIRRFNIAH